MPPRYWNGALFLFILSGVFKGAGCSNDVSPPASPSISTARLFTRPFQTLIDKTKGLYHKTWRKGRNVQREAKIYTSSPLEGCLLRATRPNDLPTKEKHIKRVVETMSRFDALRARHKIEPTKVLMSKLYKKCTKDDDWRTASKALYIIHRLLRQCDVQDAHLIAREFRAVSCKSLSPGSEYLMLGEGRWDDAVRAWLEKYTAYLVYRTNESHEDLLILGLLRTTESRQGGEDSSSTSISPVPPAPAIATTPFRRRLVSTLSATNRLIGLGLSCDRKELAEHPIVRACVDCVAKDLTELCRGLQRDDEEMIKDIGRSGLEETGDLIDEVLHAEACNYRMLFPQIKALATTYCTVMEDWAEDLPHWIQRLVGPVSGAKEESPAGEGEGKDEEQERRDEPETPQAQPQEQQQQQQDQQQQQEEQQQQQQQQQEQQAEVPTREAHNEL